VDEMGGTCGTHGRVEKSVGVLMGKPDGNRPYGWILKKWNVKMWTGFSRVRPVRSGGFL
jgi:hypothetical protein